MDLACRTARLAWLKTGRKLLPAVQIHGNSLPANRKPETRRAIGGDGPLVVGKRLVDRSAATQRAVDALLAQIAMLLVETGLLVTVWKDSPPKLALRCRRRRMRRIIRGKPMPNWPRSSQLQRGFVTTALILLLWDRCKAALTPVSVILRHAMPPKTAQWLLELLWPSAGWKTGRRTEGELRPWPWAINQGGQGHWFDSADQAVSFATIC